MSSPNSEANWRNYVKEWEKTRANPPHQLLRDLLLQALLQHPSNKLSPNNLARPAPPGFDPSSLLVGTTTLNPWLAQHMPSTLAVRAFNKWLKELPLSEPKRKVLTDDIAKTEEWWAHQPSEAIETVERVAVMMGIPVSLLGKNYDALNLLRVMTAAISLTN